MKNSKLSFILNQSLIQTDVNPSLPLLDFIRKEKHLTGTKEVCKEGDCGACTVLLGELVEGKLKYKTVTSCIYPVGNCQGKHVVTIEGINKSELLLQQQIFADENASQCGFCTPGFIMSFTFYLLNNFKYSHDEAINAIAGNICRCTGYHSIIRAVDKVITELKDANESSHISYLIEKNVLPKTFVDIENRLKEIILEQVEANEKSTIFIGGGSDLFVQKPDDLLERDAAFLEHQHLNYIVENNNRIELGGGTTFEEFKQSEILRKIIPSIKRDIDLIASLPIRNSATIGGNLSNASPIGDLTLILLALNSTLILSNGKYEREVPLSEYYLDYKKLNKKEDEFIKAVWFEVPQNNFNFSFEKVSKRTYLDIASVNTAMLIETNSNRIKNIFISAGGVAPVPKLLKETNQYLIGKDISIDTIDSALAVMQNEISPISDVRGSAEYKKILLGQLVKAHFLKLFPQLINEKEIV
ncbi:MAG: FAD binding domain-containing protein [Melioribacteraceae bacterium]|nr:MAG: FAD binding domain-containing protein [Melioribacteraceae bacterium]